MCFVRTDLYMKEHTEYGRLWYNALEKNRDFRSIFGISILGMLLNNDVSDLIGFFRIGALVFGSDIDIAHRDYKIEAAS